MKRIVISTLLALSVSACTIKPQPLTTASLSSFATDKLSRVTAGQQPITNAITLYEAMARALKYNLDFHVELYNEALASKQLAAARLEMLPAITASAGYSSRNKDAGNAGSAIFPDKSKFEDDIVLSWNILDLGLSKVRAEQAADRVLIAREQRRKIVNRVIEDVRTAYWRAVSADRLLKGLRKLEGRAKKALANSRALQRDGQTSPLTALTYQRELVEIQQRIQRLQKDLSLAKIQLAALMNVRPGDHFTLAQPPRRVDSTHLPLTSEEMVFAALENRPEIRDVQYNLRINSKESRAALLEMLPGINVFAHANYSSDDYLLHSNWVGWGAKATFNLFNVFKYPAKKRVVQAEADALDARALAVTMAIMTQVHVSRVRYGHSRKLYVTAARHLKVQKGIVHQIRESFREGQASEQTLIREEMNTLASEVSADIAYADLQNAYANVYASMGIDPYTDETFANDEIGILTSSLEKAWFERGDRSGIRRARRAAKQHVITGSVARARKSQTKKATAAALTTGSVKKKQKKSLFGGWGKRKTKAKKDQGEDWGGFQAEAKLAAGSEAKPETKTRAAKPAKAAKPVAAKPEPKVQAKAKVKQPTAPAAPKANVPTPPPVKATTASGPTPPAAPKAVKANTPPELKNAPPVSAENPQIVRVSKAKRSGGIFSGLLYGKRSQPRPSRAGLK